MITVIFSNGNGMKYEKATGIDLTERGYELVDKENIYAVVPLQTHCILEINNEEKN